MDRVAVIGACGKMGRGIALLLLQNIAMQRALLSDEKVLYLIDHTSFFSLQIWLQERLRRFGEKNVVELRKAYLDRPEVVSNREVIEVFVKEGMASVECAHALENVDRAEIVFEAIIESEKAKEALFAQLRSLCPDSTLFYTNTSSIPIRFLASRCELEERLIGFHFYNPPHLQLLVELICPWESRRKVAVQQALSLGKQVVFSHDVAGFIGNGFFMREIDYALRQVEKSSSLEQGILGINHLTKSVLKRPMGLFQLIDFVGVDVCRNIMQVMEKHLKYPFAHALLDRLIEEGRLGGVTLSGDQRKGFFGYSGKKIERIFSFDQKREVVCPPLNHEWDPEPYIERYREIANQLVKEGVCDSLEDINQVMEMGFSHPKGPGKM